MQRPSSSFPLALVTLAAGALAAHGQGYTPEQALQRMKVADGFEVKLVAAEPLVRQPVTMTFDDRGRMWVIQYLQYPNPAGLKPVSVDKYLRTKYDRVPEPPPHGPKGADRVTILYDPDEHGRFRKSKDFVTGLNLASGLCLGHGGVYVAQPPYLLFYPDRDGDDVPDGDPEVLLKGFGMEDAHAFANSLQWGPDGWLYGAHGSTSYANVRGIEFVQGVWRYHPVTREFELFSEGGGNTWGLDFDRHGNVIAGTNFGGVAMLHQFQGAYYVKGFAKHGPLKNPHAYGYFEHVPYTGFKGGHVTCGGIVYQGGLFPEKFTDQYVAANLLSNSVYWHALEPKRSGFVARFGGELIEANDTWCRPVDCLTGPDGAVYVADWYDKRATHLDPRDTWDRTNGRVYKLQPTGTKAAPAPSVAKLSSKELLGLLGHRNNWHRREARRILAERRVPTVVPLLRTTVQQDKGHLALEALWGLYVSGGFDDEFAAQCFVHPNAEVRTWAVRLLGDARKVTPGLAAKLADLARNEPSPSVRAQLACTARRLPGKDGLPIVRELRRRSEDADDPYLPLLIWWAVEAKAVSDRERVLSLLGEPADWRLPIVSRYLVERIARRYMAEGGPADLAACVRLLDVAPGPAEARLLVQGMEKALEGKTLAKVPPALERHASALRSKDPGDLTVLRFALRLGSEEAYRASLARAADPKVNEAERSGLVEVLGQTGRPDLLPVFTQAVAAAKSDGLKRAALTALQSYQDPQVGKTVLGLYPRLSGDLRGRAQALLCSRQASALDLLKEVDAGKIAAKEVSVENLRPLARFKDARIDRLVEKHWGMLGQATPGEKQNRIGYFTYALGKAKGDPVNGRVLFAKHCGTCHTLFGEGTKIGPDLTAADRKNRELLLASIVDPSAVQRLEYASYTVVTTDGRSLTGVVPESGPDTVTLVDAKNERSVLPRAKIQDLLPSPVSLMPDGILDPLDDQELRDLFSYLQADAPPAKAPPAKAGAPLKVCLVSGSVEYDSDSSLAAFQDYLEKNYNVRCTRAFRRTDTDLPGLENLDTCDVMLLFTRRLQIKGEQLERVKKYCQSGKPIVAVRTASHAFQTWLALDREVLGGDYKNHYGSGPVCKVAVVDKAKGHPILRGFRPYESAGSLYKNPNVAKDTEVLLTGTIPGHTEPVAWTRTHKGGRVFYTSLGHQRDFENDGFRRMLANALLWAAGRETPAR